MKKRVIIVIGGLLVVAVVAFFAVGGNKYISTTNKFMSYVHDGNVEASYSLLSTNAKNTYSTETWEDYVAKVDDAFPSSCEKLTKVDITNSNGTYNKPARYTCDFKLNGKNDYRILFVLLEEDGKIVIDEMQGYAL